MAIKVYIPTPFRRLTGNRTHVEADGGSVGQVLDDLDARFPGIGSLIFDSERRIPNHVNVYLNNREIHSLQGIDTVVADGDEVAVIPAIAGGAVALPGLLPTGEREAIAYNHRPPPVSCNPSSRS